MFPSYQTYPVCHRPDRRCFLHRQGTTISHLSDNIERWPKDPFAIIGVERSAERSDVRRAYSRLIRQFRPETHPVQFQKLHEAYQIALAIVDGGGAGVLFANAGPVFDFAGQPSSGQQEMTAESVWQRFSKQPNIDVLDAAKQLVESESPSADAFLMIYWMLRLHPHLSPSDNRFSWLERGLRRYPTDGRFVDLLIAEFKADSLLCVREQSRSLASMIACKESLARYLSVRWAAIGRSNAWQELSEDINQSRTLFGLDQTETWVRLLITAYEIVSFSQDHTGRQLLNKVKREIESFPDLELTLSEDLESLDLWQLFRAQRGTDHRNEIVHFVTSQRFVEIAAVEQATLDVVRRWIDCPRVGLNLLTSTAADYPEAFWQFLRYVSMIDAADPGPHDTTLATEIAEFLPEIYGESYAVMRQRILEFCQSECISPTQFFHHLAEVASTIGVGDELLNALQSDLPLYVAIQCMDVFQNAASRQSS